jgi:hypothetical protein
VNLIIKIKTYTSKFNCSRKEVRQMAKKVKKAKKKVAKKKGTKKRR